MIYKDESPCASPTLGSGSGKKHKRQIVDLPPEILEKVYLHLSLSDRLRLSRTCGTVHQIWKESATLQYHFTLETSGYIDVPGYHRGYPIDDGPSHGGSGSGPGSNSGSDSGSEDETIPAAKRSTARALISSSSGPLSAQEKNALLKEREQRWSELDAARQERMKVHGPAGVYELQEGIFLMCNDYSNRDDGRPTSIRLLPLPSTDDPTGSKIHLPKRNHKLPFSIADLTMDPTQDLIVVSEHRPHIHGTPTPTHKYHLLTLSAFQPHPEASLPILDFPPSTLGDISEVHTRQLLQVMDDVLVVLVYRSPWGQAPLIGGLVGSNSDQEVVCWNWKSGKVLARMQLPDEGWSSSFALLTPTSFVITSATGPPHLDPLTGDRRGPPGVQTPLVQIYSFAADPERHINPVQPLDFDYMDDTTPRPMLVAQLELPPFDHVQVTPIFIGTFDVRPDPAFPARPGKPFTQDPEKGVLVFELQVMKVIGPTQLEQHGYELFVLRETLIDMARAGEKRLADVRGTDDRYAVWRLEKRMEWQDWYDRARIKELSMRSRNWVCSCSGYRFVSLVHSNVEDWDSEEEDAPSAPYRKIRVLDFSPYGVRKQRNAMDHPPEVTIKVHEECDVMDKGAVFASNVWSGLPYVETVREVGVRANGVMMDDQRIIAVSTDGPPGDWQNRRQDMTIFCM